MMRRSFLLSATGITSVLPGDSHNPGNPGKLPGASPARDYSTPTAPAGGGCRSGSRGAHCAPVVHACPRVHAHPWASHQRATGGRPYGVAGRRGQCVFAHEPHLHDRVRQKGREHARHGGDVVRRQVGPHVADPERPRPHSSIGEVPDAELEFDVTADQRKRSHTVRTPFVKKFFCPLPYKVGS